EEYDFAFEITGGVLGIEEEKSEGSILPASGTAFWATTPNAAYRITDDGSPVFKIDVYGEDYGLPNDWKYPFLFQNRIVIGNGYGLFESVHQDSGVTFEPVNLYKLETSGRSFTFLKDVPGKTLAIIDNFPHLIDKKDKTDIYVPFLRFGIENPSALYYENKSLYICGETGLIVFDERSYVPETAEFDVIIRKITTKNDSVLFEGATVDPLHLQYNLVKKLNDLTVEVSSNYLNLEESTLYRYKLEGIDTAFSNWQSERKIKLFNLFEGSYKLIIQAKNINEKTSRDAVIEFTILPPWYRTIWAYILYVVAFVLFVFVAVKVASYRLKQQNRQLDNLVKQRTKEIEHKNEELKEQNEQILHQKQEITDSINYAKRIQNAILPPLKEINASWQDVFVFFQPKDIVSGDFYWYQRISDTEFLIASADCTGHGVPGGFMSMVCSDKLNEAVNHTHEPDEILKMVNRRIKQSLRQDNKEGSTKDGMEIALLKVNIETKKVKYAGANRFLWIIRKNTNEVEEIKPTKAGIGGYTEDAQEFKCHTIQFESGDLAYMSTDGYGDQFGGPEGKKLMTKNFKQFLLSVKEVPFAEQQALAADHINKWKAEYEQVDDILVIGIKF
ncbi:MAG TPA: SpoIIE family protein phosphatase, partial [Bacteroidia bacterium]